MFGLLSCVASVDVSIVNCFLGCLICASSKISIGIGFLTTPANVDCLFRTDFRVGSMVFYISDVFFLLDRFGDGAVFSKGEDHSLLDDADFSIDIYCLDVWAVFFLVSPQSRSSYRVYVSYVVFRRFSFQLVLPFFFGHSCYCNLSCFSFIVNFLAGLMLCRP